MSNWKIKFALIFAFNAKLNGYLSYILPLQFTPTNAFSLNTGRFDAAW